MLRSVGVTLSPTPQGIIEVLEHQFLGLGDLGEQMIMVALLDLVASAQVGECLLSARLVAVVPEVEVLFDSRYIQDLTEGVGLHNEGMRLVAEDQDRRMVCPHSKSELTSSGPSGI
jgi:hypothetical protein